MHGIVLVGWQDNTRAGNLAIPVLASPIGLDDRQQDHSHQSGMRIYFSLCVPRSTTQPRASWHSDSIASDFTTHIGPTIELLILHPSSMTAPSMTIELLISTFLPIFTLRSSTTRVSLLPGSIWHPMPTRLPLICSMARSSRGPVYLLGISTYFCLVPRIRLSRLTASKILGLMIRRMYSFCPTVLATTLRGALGLSPASSSRVELFWLRTRVSIRSVLMKDISEDMKFLMIRTTRRLRMQSLQSMTFWKLARLIRWQTEGGRSNPEKSQISRSLSAQTWPFCPCNTISIWGSNYTSGFFSSFAYYFFSFSSRLTSALLPKCQSSRAAQRTELTTSMGTSSTASTSSKPPHSPDASTPCSTPYSLRFPP